MSKSLFNMRSHTRGVKLLARDKMSSCAENCSGHGECFNGTCFCEIQFVGEECRTTNTSYYAGFATVFYLVAFVCLVQLIMSIVAEWQRLKSPSILKACRITTQKLLYFVVFLASAIRGAYFTSPESFDDGWSQGLMVAYYPLLLSGSSLVVCFWAEVFHLPDARWRNQHFLSKSFLGFIGFNIINYSLLIAELTAVRIFSDSPQIKGYYLLIFNGCYAVLAFVVVIFFLIYGVEVYFKMRGSYTLNNGSTTPEMNQLFHNNDSTLETKRIDASQLAQSRFGLLSQAFFMISIVLLLSTETIGELLQIKFPVPRRNIFTVVFRIVEIALALWFPCCLWNSMSPEQLWILNPNRLIKEREPKLTRLSQDDAKRNQSETASLRGAEECWICYDSSRNDVGPMIQPCQCRGDVRFVHHDCLLNWLAEKPSRKDCRVCGAEYRFTKNRKLLTPGRIASKQDWKRTSILIFLMTGSVISACLTVNLVRNTLAKSIAVGTALLVLYVCIKVLCQNMLESYQRAKISALRIEDITSDQNNETHLVPTISQQT